MKEQDKIAILFGIGLNVLIAAIVFIGATYYIV